MTQAILSPQVGKPCESDTWETLEVSLAFFCTLPPLSSDAKNILEALELVFLFFLSSWLHSNLIYNLALQTSALPSET
jgi:hypothetical protein